MSGYPVLSRHRIAPGRHGRRRHSRTEWLIPVDLRTGGDACDAPCATLAPSRVRQLAAGLWLVVGCALVAQADIFQWEYVNPADPSQGKQQSTTLAPGGAGVDAVPGVNLAWRNLTMATIRADLTGAYGNYAN